MPTRRTKAALFAVCLSGLAVAAGAGPAAAVSSVGSGWWTSTPVLVAPDVGDDLLVQGGRSRTNPLPTPPWPPRSDRTNRSSPSRSPSLAAETVGATTSGTSRLPALVVVGLALVAVALWAFAGTPAARDPEVATRT